MAGMRVLLLGGSGTIGRAVASELVARGHDVICPLRPGASAPPGVDARVARVEDPASLRRDGLAGARVDAVVSCLASRTGVPAEAEAIDHRATVDALHAARDAGARRAVLLSAICVQKPHLAFQHAKLRAEAAWRAAGLDWSIVRPTAYFKSLSGQIDRLRAGKPFLLFGDGRLTASKPISDRDLARFMADCLSDSDKLNRILPIGGLGPAITPREQGHMLFEALGRTPRFRSVSPRILSGAARLLDAGAVALPRLRTKAELARIGHYYATESMLVWDPATGRYDADATPETGRDTLRDHYARLAATGTSDARGDHAVF